MRSIVTITLGLFAIASLWTSSADELTSPLLSTASAATVRSLANSSLRGTDDLGDGLPAFPQTLLVDSSNLRASRALPQPDYDYDAERARAALGRASFRTLDASASLYDGYVYDSLSPEPLGGASVSLTQPGRRYATTANRNGYFAIEGVPPGVYLLAVSKSAAYATLHAMVNVRAGRTDLRLRLLVLSPEERAWLVQLGYEREYVASPRTRELGTDQYAVLIARELAADVAAGKAPFSDATEERYAARYAALPGAVYQAAVSGAIVPSPDDYLAADRLWMAEKANCPSGDWQTCPFEASTGHYINISSGLGMWMGIGESSRSFSYLGYPGYHAYYVLTIES